MENLLLVAAVINRLVELIKQALPAENETVEKWRAVLLLALSFVMGSLAMIFVFPANNMFPDASSPLAGLIFSGILVGGVANGYDWLGGIVQQRTSATTTKTAVQFSASSIETPTPADVLARG